MTRGGSLRAAVLLGAAAMGVHESAYVLGGNAGAAAGHGLHGYMWHQVPVIGVLFVAAGTHFVLTIAGAGRGVRRPEPSGPQFGVMWLAAGTLLGLAWVAQEWVETALGPAGPERALAAVGSGGATPFAIAAVLGGIVALLLRGADDVLASAPRGPSTVLLRCRPSTQVRGCFGAVTHDALDAVARHLAGRGPPFP